MTCADKGPLVETVVEAAMETAAMKTVTETLEKAVGKQSQRQATV